MSTVLNKAIEKAYEQAKAYENISIKNEPENDYNRGKLIGKWHGARDVYTSIAKYRQDEEAQIKSAFEAGKNAAKTKETAQEYFDKINK